MQKARLSKLGIALTSIVSSLTLAACGGGGDGSASYTNPNTSATTLPTKPTPPSKTTTPDAPKALTPFTELSAELLNSYKPTWGLESYTSIMRARISESTDQTLKGKLQAAQDNAGKIYNAIGFTNPYFGYAYKTTNTSRTTGISIGTDVGLYPNTPYAFAGDGVNIAIIDEKFNALAYDSQLIKSENIKNVKLNTDLSSLKTSENQFVAETWNPTAVTDTGSLGHGSNVLRGLASYRGTYSSEVNANQLPLTGGVAPRANYFLFDAADTLLSQIYKGDAYKTNATPTGGWKSQDYLYYFLAQTSKARIINYSGGVNVAPTDDDVKKFDTKYKTVVDKLKSRNNFDSEFYTQLKTKVYDNHLAVPFAQGIKSAAKGGNGPLLVKALGNVDKFTDALEWNKHVNNLKPDAYKPYEQVVKISKDSDLYALINSSQEAKDSILFVAGVITDTKGTIKNEITNLINKFNSNTLTDTERNKKLEFTFANGSADFTTANMEAKKIYLSPASFACGAIKDNCIVAPYVQSFNFYTNNNNLQSLVGQGTSYSAPLVTGVAALVAQQFPWLTTSQLKQVLTTTAYDLGAKGLDDVYGWGMVNAQLALRGPAAFYKGQTFKVNLTNNNAADAQHYVFSNNIYGEGNLEVTSTTSTRNFLYLVGPQGFTGNITVKSNGNLAISRDGTFVPPTYKADTYPQAELQATKVSVEKDSVLALSNVEVNTLSNNGGNLFTFGATANNLELNGGQTTIYLKPNETTQEYEGLKIKGKAKLNGNVYVALQKGYNFKTGTYTVKVISYESGESTVSFNVGDANKSMFYSLDNWNVNKTALTVDLTVHSSSDVSSLIDVGLTSVDALSSYRGAQQVDKLFAAADNVLLVDAATSNSDSQIKRNNTERTDALSDLRNTTAYNEYHLSSSLVSTTALTADVSPTSPINTNEQENLGNQDNNELIVAATQVQNMSKTELQDLFIRTSGVQYHNLQLAANQTLTANAQGFTNAASRYLSTDNRFFTYLDYDYGKQNWSSSKTLLRGDFSSNGLTAGTYWQDNGYNFGVAAYASSFRQHESLRSLKAEAGYAKGHTYALLLNFGQAAAKYWLNAGLTIAHNDYDVERSTLYFHDQKAHFSSNSVGLDLNAGYLLLGNQNTRLEVQGGLLGQITRQAAFAEKATNIASEKLSLQAKARTHFTSYAHAGLRGFINFEPFNYATSLDASLVLQQKLGSNRFNLDLIDGSQTGYAFTNSFLATLNLGASIQLTHNLNLRFATTYSKAEDWESKNANLTLKVAF